ncbi:sensor histidine kinase [Corynebacterium jeddahense]|uniref:histidine kinase n=1 Tax=Corynebacterium jeddahense TaxID=1414719 RepID=A0ABY7UPP0_9CORY|nr:histidine kinase [Corynebacterium jeddahense]WCZ39750.1 Sensor histidine kinase DesK [Corynebacterium jeddahense]
MNLTWQRATVLVLVAILAVVFAFDWATVQSPYGAAGTAAGAALIVACGACCLAYGARPVAAVAGIAACASLALCLNALSIPLYWEPALAFGAVVTSSRVPRRDRAWLTVWLLAIPTVALFTHGLFAEDWPGGQSVGRAAAVAARAVVLSWVFLGFFFLLGAQLRNRREKISELEQQIEFAHVRERTQIAREMHDIVAHTLAGITALADGARYASKADPQVAQEALATISAESRTALTQMRGLLSVLRDDDGAPTGATPGRRDFAALFDDARNRGLDLTVTGFDELPEDLPALTQFTLYRICQEAITNMLRHASTPQGAITFSADAKSVRVEAVNAASKSKHGPDGFGLVGIRERVAAHGGRVSVTNDGGEFVLTAEVPR